MPDFSFGVFQGDLQRFAAALFSLQVKITPASFDLKRTFTRLAFVFFGAFRPMTRGGATSPVPGPVGPVGPVGEAGPVGPVGVVGSVSSNVWLSGV